MHKHNDTLIGLFTGAVGGGAKFFLTVEPSFVMRFLAAGVTALFCGLCGVAGKELYYLVKRKISKK